MGGTPEIEMPTLDFICRGTAKGNQTPCNLAFLAKNNTQITILVGDKDGYITIERLKTESKRMETLFDGRAEQIIFDGKHEIRKELLDQFVQMGPFPFWNLPPKDRFQIKQNQSTSPKHWIL